MTKATYEEFIWLTVPARRVHPGEGNTAAGSQIRKLKDQSSSTYKKQRG